jgi:adenosylcobinamide-phosphate guanylyltransferase
MQALVMCGGAGTRLDAAVEKPLLEVGGEPMVDRVLGALAESRISEPVVAVSPQTPATHDHLHEREVACIETPGEGYVEDIGVALADDRLERPVLTVVADLPLLAPQVVNWALARHEGGALTVCVPVALKEALGVSVDTAMADPSATPDADTAAAHGGPALAPTGLNVVGKSSAETVAVSWDARLAVNVNYRADAAVADSLAGVADGP